METHPIERGVSAIHLVGVIPLNVGSVLEIGSVTDQLRESFLRRNPATSWTHERSLPSDDHHEYGAILLRASGYEARKATVTLKAVRRLLSIGGVLIFELPNPAHWYGLFLALSGATSDSASPITDWLFPVSMEALDQGFADAGMMLRRAQVVRVALPDAVSEMVDRICRAELFGRELSAERVKARLAERSYILSACFPKQAENGRRHGITHSVRLTIAVLAMAPSFADVRTKLPLAAFASLPDVEVIYIEKQGNLPSLPIDQAKVLVVQRQLPDNEDAWRSVIGRLHEKGWAVIAEWDDHPDLFAAPIRAKFDKAPWASVRLADAVQTSTSALGREIRRQGCEDVIVFDNRLLELPEVTSGHRDNAVRILLSGLNRTAEFLNVVEQLNELIARGHSLDLTVVQDRVVYDAIKSPKKTFFPHLKYDEYNIVIRRCNVVLMPLFDSLGNRCKSDLKWVECASHGMACIGSRVVYGETIRHGIDGLVADEVADFGGHVLTLIKMPGLITSLGEAARLRVANERMLYQVVEERISWYLSVWERVTAARLTVAADE